MPSMNKGAYSAKSTRGNSMAASAKGSQGNMKKGGSKYDSNRGNSMVKSAKPGPKGPTMTDAY